LVTPIYENLRGFVKPLRPTNGNGSASIARPRVVNGRGLGHLGPSKRKRAVLAAQVVDGVLILQPSVVQLARLFGVSSTYITRARRLTPETREDVLLDLNTVRARGAFLPPSAEASIPANDNELDMLVRKHGAERLWRAIERAL
jgi:hypothetical protein